MVDDGVEVAVTGDLTVGASPPAGSDSFRVGGPMAISGDLTYNSCGKSVCEAQANNMRRM